MLHAWASDDEKPMSWFIFTRGDLGQFRWSRSMGAGMAWEETMAARRSVIQSVCGNFWIWWTMKSSSQSTRSASLRASHASPSPSFLIRAKLGWERRARQDAIIVWRLTGALYKIVRSCQIIDFNSPIFLLEVGQPSGEFASRSQLQPCALVVSCHP